MVRTAGDDPMEEQRWAVSLVRDFSQEMAAREKL